MTAGHIGVYLGDREFCRASWGASSSHFATPSGFLLEVTSPLGVHRLSEQPTADHAAFLEAMLSAARDAGPVDADVEEPEFLCMLAQGASSSVLVAAKRDALGVARVDVTETGIEVQGEFDPTDPSGAVAALFEAAGIA